MGRTALHNSVLLLLLVFAFIYPNCMTSTTSNAQVARCLRGPQCAPRPSGNSTGTREPGRPMPSTGPNGATWPGRPTLRRTRASNPSALLPILVTISIASVLVWSWRRGRRRNSEASRTHLVAVADPGQQTIKFMSVSPRSGNIFPGIQGRSR